MKEINLFDAYVKVPQKKLDLIRKTRVVSIVFLIAYCLVLAGVFSYWLVLKGQASSLSKKIETQQREIKRYEKTETLHVLVKQRLLALAPFLAKASVNQPQVLGEIESLVPEGIVLGSFNFKDDGGFGCEGQARDALVLGEFLDKVVQLNEDNFPEKIDLSSVSRVEEGGYSFALSFNAGK